MSPVRFFDQRSPVEPHRTGPAPAVRPVVPTQRDGNSCDLYGPGHQMHYRHQGQAIHSTACPVLFCSVEEASVLLVLEDGREVHWRHHDPERLRRMLEAYRGPGTAYPEFHALQLGPSWFNCARETDPWQDCRRLITGAGAGPQD